MAKKWEVLPVSAIAMEVLFGEGPSAAVDICFLLSVVIVSDCRCSSLSTQFGLGVPRSYSWLGVSMAALARLGRSGRL